MSDESVVGGSDLNSFEELLEQSFKDKEVNTILNLTIVDIQEAEKKVFLDLNEKLEGFLDIEELLDDNGNLTNKVGDNLDVVIVERRNGRAILSHKKVLEKRTILDYLEKNGDTLEDSFIDVIVKKKVSGGYIVTYGDNVVFFLPFKLASFKAGVNSIGKKIRVKVVKVDKEKGSVIVSRVAQIIEYKKGRKAEITKLLEAGEAEGTVKVILGYGIFVDFDMVEAFVSYKEISYKGPVNPASYYKVGDKVKVAFLSYNKEKNYIEGSIKKILKDPWGNIFELIKVGDIVDARVMNIENFGLFVDMVENDLEAFVHISEFSNDKSIKNIKEHISKGDSVKIKIINIDEEKKQIKASIKALQPKQIDVFIKKYTEGDVVSGRIVNFIEFGAFINIDGLDCFLHNRNYSWSGEKISNLLNKGDEVESKISEINLEKGKVYLSRLDLLEHPFVAFSKNVKIGDEVTGSVKNIKNFGVFVSIEEGIDALIKREDLPRNSELKIGDTINAKIVYMSPKDHKIRLTTKENIDEGNERVDLDSFNKQNLDTGMSNLGLALKEKFKN